jgi:hypothetical protein
MILRGGENDTMRLRPSSTAWVRRTARLLVVAAITVSTTACAPISISLEYITQQSLDNSDPNKLAVAHCPAGKKVTGGGVSVSLQTLELAVIRSEPTSDHGGWLGQAVEVSPFAGNWRVASTAICGG